MFAMTSNEWTIVISALTGGICTLLTVIFMKGIPAYIKLKEQTAAQDGLEEDKARSIMEATIARLEARLDIVEKRNIETSTHHLECERKHARLEATVEHQAKEIERQAKEIERLQRIIEPQKG